MDKPGFNICNKMFSLMSTDSGCSITHSDSNDEVTRDFIVSLEIGTSFIDLFTTLDCKFIKSDSLGT